MFGLSRHLSIRLQLLFLFALVLAAGIAVLLLDEAERRDNARVVDQLREESIQSLRIAKSMSDAYGLDYIGATIRVRNELISWEEGLRIVDNAHERIERSWAQLSADSRTQRQREMLSRIRQARGPADSAARKLRDILARQDSISLGIFADTELFPAMDPVAKRLKALSDLQLIEADRRVRQAAERAREASAKRLALTGAGVLLMGLFASSMVRNIYRGVESLRDLSTQMRRRDYASAPRFHPSGELGQVMDGFLEMRDAVRRFENELNASELAAREANIAKSSFLAVMSHEIRTPMIGITGMLEVLSHSHLDGEQRRTMHVIQQSAASLLRIVGDILDFSKVEAGRIDLSPQTICLQDLLQSILASFAGSASSKGLVLRLQLDPRAAPAHVADGLRLRQVLANFVSNAVKFTERGSIELALERRAREGDRELLRFRVTDTGIGVTAEQQAQLFQPFSQAEGSTSRRFGGTGLGLVISRRLAELMGGQVSMSSETGAGTTMVLELALPIGRVEDLDVEAAAGPAAQRFEPRPLPSIAQAEADRSLVLVVDDHPTNRLVISRQLALAGYASESAEDGVAGLRAMRSGRYALVLSDVHMPVMDGYEMTRQWRMEESAGGRERTPVVALTAAALAGEAERCLAAGMDDYLAKPVSIPALAACVRKWLPHTAQAPAPSAGPSPPPVLPQARTPPLPLQPGVIEELSQGDRRLAAELMQDFLASTDDDLAELQQALSAGDAARQARQAHRILGASQLVGAGELAEAARALELAARAADWTRLQPACAEVQTAAERLRLYVAAEYAAGA